MNFDFTEAEHAFAQEVRGFLRASPPESFAIDGMDAGYGSGANSRAFMKALAAQGWISMRYPDFPEPIGVFRDVDVPKYDVEVNRQIQSAREKKGEGDLNALFNSGDTWSEFLWVVRRFNRR